MADKNTPTKLITMDATASSLGGEAVVISSTDHTASYTARRIHVGGAGGGALKVTTVDGSVLTFAGVTANTLFEIAIVLVWKTGTDVTNMTLLW